MDGFMNSGSLQHLQTLEKFKSTIEKDIEARKQQLQTVNDELYTLKVRTVHIEEIYRQAAIQFARLRPQTGAGLTVEDKAELNKWIARAKDESGLTDIISALKELSKYYPGDIRSNLYALVQKIIIGGAYKKKGRAK